MKNLKLSRKMYDQYMATVKDNKGITKEQAELKMTRNAILGVTQVRAKKDSTYNMYGGLHFIVANGNIVWMKNHCGTPKGWTRNNRLYIKLNKELGINDDITLLELYKKDLTYKYKHNKDLKVDSSTTLFELCKMDLTCKLKLKMSKFKNTMKSKREALASN